MRSMEAVFSRMGDKMTRKEIGVKGRVDLFKVKQTPLNENPCDFPKPFFPVFQMMNDAEIKDRVHAGIRVGEVLGVGNKEKGEWSSVAMESFLCKSDHGGIDINGIHAAGMERIANKLHALAPAAPDLKTEGAWRERSGFLKKSDLSSLDPGARRAVDPDSFRPVDFHSFELSLS